ncbi:hypothetical protein M378DRAFT_6548 [Amanita muscaria Koide BX008]|uniref:Autophagy-related protein 14 n=1 Tax=Amanita muscaria (strain Koide BX008) TaxID=946122 RepID=A0A0C2XM30_AMAMK|nr:hypothetical protein M378DRAFT_6548 [Amanita muscaria Koide BX008]
MSNETENALVVFPAFTQPRIRNITSFQIRNLSPFPLRDSLALAITKPAEQSQFTPYGHHSDDLDLTISKRRPRKISSNSVGTRRSTRSDGSDQLSNSPVLGAIASGREKRPSIQKSEFVEDPSIRRHSTSPSKFRQPRSRKTSMSIMGTRTSAIMFPDTSQEGLESVMDARLVESRLVVTIVPPEQGKNISATPPAATPLRKSKEWSTVRAIGTKAVTGRRSFSARGHETTRISSAKSNGVSNVITHVKSASSASVRRNESSLAAPSVHSPKADSVSAAPMFPSYISPVHRPSTNPIFQFDLNVLDDDSSYLIGHKLMIEAWGKLCKDRSTVNIRDKGKEKQKDSFGQAEWKLINSWDIDVEKLAPLPDEVRIQLLSLTEHLVIPSQAELTYLSPNTLLVTLSPFGQVYYVPLHQGTGVRTQSPELGYSSEPESEIQSQEPEKDVQGVTKELSDGRRRRRRRRDPLHASEYQVTTTTATWQDLSKVVSLQSQVEDAISSLLSVQSEIGKNLKANHFSSFGYEEQQRSTALQDLRDDHLAIQKKSTELKDRIKQRSKDIEERRRMLTSVQQQRVDLTSRRTARDIEIVKARTRLEDLRRRIAPTRVALLSTLATIFPIDLYSPPDLLYTILGVPLPIPVSQREPAPPLSMPTQKNVTEDGVATALGYVAQVVQLIAAYLGKGLVYPVVCIGSKSLIRDNISAMVGPRMFPLFSKGVDAYRFEYGVFLLNKNIDMLMMDRDLRALDMRHTLPNLKNLMLILTYGESVQLPPRRSTESLSISLQELDTSTETEEGIESTTPKGQRYSPLAPDSSTPPTSGATTPNTGHTILDAAKSERPLLGLGSLTDFIRLRYPTSHRARGPSSEEVEEDKNAIASHGKGTEDGPRSGDGHEVLQEARQGDAHTGGEVTEDKHALSVRVLAGNVQAD